MIFKYHRIPHLGQKNTITRGFFFILAGKRLKEKKKRQINTWILPKSRKSVEYECNTICSWHPGNGSERPALDSGETDKQRLNNDHLDDSIVKIT